MEERFIERRFEAIDKRQAETEQELEKHTTLLQEISTEQKSQSELLQKISREQDELSKRFEQIDTIDKKLDRIDTKQDQHAEILFKHSKSISTLHTAVNALPTKDDWTAMEERLIDKMRTFLQPKQNGHSQQQPGE